VGEVPDWYPLLKAAQWLHVPPWELAEQPAGWHEMALIAMNAEGRARETLNKQGQQGYSNTSGAAGWAS